MILLALLLAAPPPAPAPAPLPLAPLSAPPAPFNPEARGTVGVQFELPGGGAPTVGVTYFVADGLAVRLDFGLDATLTPSSASDAAFSVGVGVRFYQLRRDRAALFLQPAFSFGRAPGLDTTNRPAGFETLGFSCGLGVEYFLLERFSMGGILSLGLNLGGIGSNSAGVSTKLSTATSGLFASIYF